jgi:hypothetical protein
MAVNIKKIKSVFDQSENSFLKCYDTLEKLKGLKTADSQVATDLITFQERLALALFEFQKLRNQITTEMQGLVSRKERLSKQWFTGRMKRLAGYAEGIDSAINIGKAIGDAFAWHFYRSNLDLLINQYGHRRIPGFVFGTGGAGEMAFLTAQKHLDQKLTIYHGTTNILRYGDFSFYDLMTHEISEIGELKTKKVDDKTLELSLTLIATKTTKQPKENVVTEIRIDPKMDQRTAQRLKRQIESIA